MALGKNGVLRYGHFGEFLEYFWRMANLGLIDFKIGMYIKVNVNTWQNKFVVHIYQLVKIAINWHKIGQIRLWHKNIKLGITWSFSSNFDILVF